MRGEEVRAELEKKGWGVHTFKVFMVVFVAVILLAPGEAVSGFDGGDGRGRVRGAWDGAVVLLVDADEALCVGGFVVLKPADHQRL